MVKLFAPLPFGQGLPGLQAARASPECIPRPRWPPPNLIQLVLPVNSLVCLLVLPVNLLIFWDWIACQFTTLFLYSSMVLLQLACVFFSRFLESRKYKIQIVARVGRKSAVVLSGLTEASYCHFFIGRGFRESTSTTRKRQARKTCPNKTPITSGVEESNSPRRALLLLLSDSPGGHRPKKKQWLCER